MSKIDSGPSDVAAAARAAAAAAAAAAAKAAAEAAAKAAAEAAAKNALATLKQQVIGSGFDRLASTTTAASSPIRVDTAMQMVTARLDALPPDADVTRTLKSAFRQEFELVATRIANGSITGADASVRAGQWLEVANALIPGRDLMDASESGGLVSTQSSRGRLEADNDWSLTTRMDAQDLQGRMVVGLLNGQVPWEAGLEYVKDLSKALPPEGQPVTLAERAEVLEELGGCFDEFWAMAPGSRNTSILPAVRASSLANSSDPAKTLSSFTPTADGTPRTRSDVIAEFVPMPVMDVEQYNSAALAFSRAVHNADIPVEYHPVTVGLNAAPGPEWSFKDGDKNPLHYFIVDVRNPSTGKSEQNVYHLNPETGVLSQVSNLDAQGRRLQDPVSGPWTAGPVGRAQGGGTTRSLEAQLAALGVTPGTHGARKSWQLPLDVNLQDQSDGTIKVWKGKDKAGAVTLPADTLRTTDLMGGSRLHAVPQTAANVRGPRQEATLEVLGQIGSLTIDPTTRRPRLGLNDSIAYWVDQQGRLNVQDRRGPEGVDRGNPDNPIYQLSLAETSKLVGVDGGGWGYVLSDPGAPQSPLNPRPQCGPLTTSTPMATWSKGDP